MHKHLSKCKTSEFMDLTFKDMARNENLKEWKKSSIVLMLVRILTFDSWPWEPIQGILTTNVCQIWEQSIQYLVSYSIHTFYMASGGRRTFCQINNLWKEC